MYRKHCAHLHGSMPRKLVHSAGMEWKQAVSKFSMALSLHPTAGTSHTCTCTSVHALATHLHVAVSTAPMADRVQVKRKHLLAARRSTRLNARGDLPTQTGLSVERACLRPIHACTLLRSEVSSTACKHGEGRQECMGRGGRNA